MPFFGGRLSEEFVVGFFWWGARVLGELFA